MSRRAIGRRALAGGKHVERPLQPISFGNTGRTDSIHFIQPITSKPGYAPGAGRDQCDRRRRRPCLSATTSFFSFFYGGEKGVVCRSLAPSSSSSFARPLAQSATAAASPSPALPRPKRERKPGLSLAHSFPDHGEEDDEREQTDEGRAEGLRVGDHNRATYKHVSTSFASASRRRFIPCSISLPRQIRFIARSCHAMPR